MSYRYRKTLKNKIEGDLSYVKDKMQEEKLGYKFE